MNMLLSRGGNCELMVLLSPFDDAGVGGEGLSFLGFLAAISAAISGVLTTRGSDTAGRDRGIVDGSFVVATSRWLVIATMASLERRDCLRATRNSVAIADLLLIIGG